MHCDSPANAACAAGDERDLGFELVRRSISRPFGSGVDFIRRS